MPKIAFKDETFKKGQAVLVRNCSGEDWRSAVFRMKVLDEFGRTVYVVREEGKEGNTGWMMCRLADSQQTKGDANA